MPYVRDHVFEVAADLYAPGTIDFISFVRYLVSTPEEVEEALKWKKKKEAEAKSNNLLLPKMDKEKEDDPVEVEKKDTEEKEITVVEVDTRPHDEFSPRYLNLDDEEAKEAQKDSESKDSEDREKDVDMEEAKGDALTPSEIGYSSYLYCSSKANEAATWKCIKQIAKDALKKYPTTMELDD